MVQYSQQLDSAFAALSDPTRRGILERLGRSDASITDLASRFDMILTGMTKHVRTLEAAKLVTTDMLEGPLDRLGELLERRKDIP